MANTTQPKLFEADLSNYAEIRRGLSPAMRAATPTKTALKRVDADTRADLINVLNDWRLQGQASKKASAHTQEGVGSVLSSQAGSSYYSPSEKIKIQTAAIKLKTMDPRQAEWEIKEALNAAGRLHNQDFYKAQYYLDRGDWDVTQADDGMLTAILTGGTLPQYGDDIVDETVKEYVKRLYGFSSDDAGAFDALAQSEKSEMQANYYNDILNIAKVINGR